VARYLFAGGKGNCADIPQPQCQGFVSFSPECSPLPLAFKEDFGYELLGSTRWRAKSPIQYRARVLELTATPCRWLSRRDCSQHYDEDCIALTNIADNQAVLFDDL
jgi:hypothetical protein